MNTPELYRLHAQMCKVFSSPLRLEIIDLLRDGERTVSQLSERLRVPIATVSQHLAVMRAQRILVSRRDGNLRYYRVANAKIFAAFDSLREILFERIEAEHALLEGGNW